MTIILSAIPACAQSLVYGDINGDGKAFLTVGDTTTVSVTSDSGSYSVSSSDSSVVVASVSGSTITLEARSVGTATIHNQAERTDGHDIPPAH